MYIEGIIIIMTMTVSEPNLLWVAPLFAIGGENPPSDKLPFSGHALKVTTTITFTYT
jgi:hypothetical protein